MRILCIISMLTLPLLCLCQIDYVDREETDSGPNDHSNEDDYHHRHSSSSSEEDTTTYQCNDLVYEGRHRDGETNVDLYEAITSPNFPEPYPIDNEFECSYYIRNNAGGHVRLIFDDFLLSRGDSVIIRDGWFRKFTFTEGQRPSSLVSRNYFLRIEFKSNGNSNRATGFKARYVFTESREWTDSLVVRQSILAHPSSTFMASNPCQRSKQIDYIWILRGLDNMGLAIGIEDMFFHTDDNGRDTTTLQIHDGPTSEAPLLAEIRRAEDSDYSHHLHYESTSSTVYVRLRSPMDHGDELLGTFASTTHPDDTGHCPRDFYRCEDGTCIYHDVVCDGYNQCRDRSDEYKCTVRETTTPIYESYCSQCVNSRYCSEDRKICDCQEGYVGDLCQYEDDVVYHCDQCLNGAYCRIATDGSLVCQCPTGYYGTFCELLQEDNCRYECYNGGKCTDEGECICQDGYYGFKCEIKEEPVDDCGGCQNDGICQRDGYCVCKYPHTGTHCERDRNMCDGGCWHGGICEYGSCSCRYGYYGDRCQYSEPTGWHNYEDNAVNGWYIGGMVAASVLFLVLLVTTCCCVKRRYCSSAQQSKKKIKPYTVSAKLKYTATMPTRFDECHKNLSYVPSEKDNVSLPPSYDDINIYSNDPSIVEPPKDVRDVELNTIKGNEVDHIVPQDSPEDAK